MTLAFLFDIDGCLTLPGHSRSVLDVDLMDTIYELDQPVALVTGRSDGWLRDHYQQQDRLNYLQIPTYIEFGLARISGEDVIVQQKSSDFLDTRISLIDDLADVCQSQGIYFEPDEWYDDYPAHDSLWVEDKHIQLSIAANTTISVDKVHELTSTAWSGRQDDARFLNHHLGVDVLPPNWSKAEATSHFIEELDETAYEWYVFGDNSSDREMLEGLSSATFVSTRQHGSTDVRTVLTDLGLF